MNLGPEAGRAGPEHVRKEPRAEVDPGRIIASGLRQAALAVLVVSAMVAVAGALLEGSPAARGALVGGLIVACFFAFGSLSVGYVTIHFPAASMLFALMTYVLQIGVLALLLRAVDQERAAGLGLDLGWLAGAVIVATLTWTVSLVATALRSDWALSEAERELFSNPSDNAERTSP